MRILIYAAKSELRCNASASSSFTGCTYPVHAIYNSPWSKNSRISLYIAPALLISVETPVGMSAYLMHNDHNVHTERTKFIPERCLGSINAAMYKSYVPFCRGSRNCLGMK
jgi:hypothetical protein